ncbi:MAG: MerR family transcriptional regulator [Acidimicrobiales bacterium]
MAEERPGSSLSRGELARRARLTPKALRVYERVGLLSPVGIEETNGYRRYGADQVRTGQLIGLLRGADLSLADIALVLDDLARDAKAAVTRLDQLLAQINRRHADRLLVIRHVQATLREGDDPMFPIETRHVPARRVMSIQRRLHAQETDGFARETKASFVAHLGATEPTGPFCLIFHGVVDAECDGPLEAVLGCPEDVLATEEIGIRTEPAHDEAYTTITKAQWAYPAILAAYDAVACSPEVRARPGSRLSCREVYLAAPDSIGDDEPICDVAFPLGDP